MLYSLVTVKPVEQLGEKERVFTSYLRVTRTVLVIVNCMTSKPEGQVSELYGDFACTRSCKIIQQNYQELLKLSQKHPAIPITLVVKKRSLSRQP